MSLVQESLAPGEQGWILDGQDGVGILPQFARPRLMMPRDGRIENLRDHLEGVYCLALSFASIPVIPRHRG